MRMRGDDFIDSVACRVYRANWLLDVIDLNYMDRVTRLSRLQIIHIIM